MKKKITGVIRQGSGHSAYGTHRSGAVVAVNLTSNASAIGVGTLAKSSAELSTANNSGICVNMLHVFGDKLWNIEPSVCLQVPDAGAVLKAPTMNDFPTLGESLKSTRDKADASKIPNAVEKVKQETVALETNLENLELTSDENVAVADGQDGLAESNEEADSGQSPDDKLKQAFLTALKKMGKKPPVPLLTSNFYRNHILTVDGSIDIKKTTYKKLSKFLQDMASGNYITVKEEPKGVEKIVAVNSQHPDVVNTILNVDAGGKDDAKGNGADGLFVTEMKEIYTVTADTMKFFNIFDIKRGEAIEPAQVKKYVKDYVCNNKLQDPKNIRSIHVDDVLREMCDIDATVQVVPFEDILMTVMEKMDHNFAMRHRNELKTSGKQSTIKMTLATRCGNKQVTLVDHLEMFGIRLTEFAQTCKIGVASSTSIIRPDCPGNSNKGQIMIQGNQVRFVHKLLTETYKIPPKMITGLELAKKEKKAKKK